MTSPFYGQSVQADVSQPGGVTNYNLYNPQEHQAEIQVEPFPNSLRVDNWYEHFKDKGFFLLLMKLVSLSLEDIAVFSEQHDINH